MKPTPEWNPGIAKTVRKLAKEKGIPPREVVRNAFAAHHRLSTDPHDPLPKFSKKDNKFLDKVKWI